MISSDYAEQFVVTLPEETKLSEILISYQRWQDSVKKIFHFGSLKSGVTLQTLQSLLQECDGIPVELELESKHIRAIVSEASEWIQSFAGVLESLHIPITSIDVARSVLDSEHVKVNDVTENQENAESVATDNRIGYSELKILIDAAHHVTVHFPELM